MNEHKSFDDWLNLPKDLQKLYHRIKPCFDHVGWYKRHEMDAGPCICEQNGLSNLITKCWIKRAIDKYNLYGLENL